MTSLIGIVINLATEWKLNPWAWVCVAVLTGLGVVAAMKVQATPPAGAPPTRIPPVPRHGVHNHQHGQAGLVIQTGALGAYNDHSVNQRAVARDNGTIHQAGRDIRFDGSP
ncbi:MAG: hypothetical protein ABIQ18_19285 [Umezawaea sp.]